MHSLISEGRSNAYICNYHAFCDLNLQVLPLPFAPHSFAAHFPRLPCSAPPRF